MHILTSFGPAMLAGAAAVVDTADPSGSVAHAIGVVVGVVLIAVVLLFVLLVIAMWKLFIKAGQPGWASIIPLYGNVKWLEMVNLPLWWIILVLIPIVNIPFVLILSLRIARVFGKGKGFGMGLFFVPFIFYPILAFGRSVYANTFPPSRPISDATRWALIGGFCVFVFEMFMIVIALLPSQQPLRVLAPYDAGYATDGTYVYYTDESIPGANASSFRAINYYYATDRFSVYYLGQPIEGADPYTFKAILYVYGGGEYGAFDGADAGTPYGKDDAGVYYDGELIAGADDPDRFRALDDTYAADDAHVYAYGSIMDVADPATFVAGPGLIAGQQYDARDDRHYFRVGDVVAD